MSTARSAISGSPAATLRQRTPSSAAAWRPRSSNNDASTPAPSFVRWPEHSKGSPLPKSTVSCVRRSPLSVYASPPQRYANSPQTSPQDVPSI